MLNAAASRAAKDAGQQIALDMADDWKGRVLLELRAWLAARRAEGETVIAIEQFRAVAKNHPSSFRAWGTLPMLAVRAGLLAPLAHADGSPVMRFAEAVKTHRHPVRCWLISAASPSDTEYPRLNGRASIPVKGSDSACFERRTGRVSHSGGPA